MDALPPQPLLRAPKAAFSPLSPKLQDVMITRNHEGITINIVIIMYNHNYPDNFYMKVETHSHGRGLKEKQTNRLNHRDSQGRGETDAGLRGSGIRTSGKSTAHPRPAPQNPRGPESCSRGCWSELPTADPAQPCGHTRHRAASRLGHPATPSPQFALPSPDTQGNRTEIPPQATFLQPGPVKPSPGWRLHLDQRV